MAFRFCLKPLQPWLNYSSFRASITQVGRFSCSNRVLLTQKTNLLSDALFSRLRFSSQAPKGFERFFPGASKQGPKNAKSEGKSSSQSNKPPGGGTSGGKKPKPWWDSFYEAYQQQIWLAVGLSLGTGYLLMSSGTPTREINWQEFRTNYLEKGDVEKLIVSNKSQVKVYTKNSMIDGQLTFTIGSVENFERNLENVQQEMNIDPAYWVPVTYVKESEWL